MRKIIICSALSLLALACAGPMEFRKTHWTIDEVKSWYLKYSGQEPSLSHGIIYQGSDERFHHFIARMQREDNWAIIQIERSDLTLPDVRQYPSISSGTLGFYYVDPNRDFLKTGNYP